MLLVLRMMIPICNTATGGAATTPYLFFSRHIIGVLSLPVRWGHLPFSVLVIFRSCLSNDGCRSFLTESNLRVLPCGPVPFS
eukprot:scaffold4942_cov182-Skeletonema_marinoi.AAC.2